MGIYRLYTMHRNEAGEGGDAGGGGEPAAAPAEGAPSSDNALQRQGEPRVRKTHAEKRNLVATTAGALKAELAARKAAERAAKPDEPAGDPPKEREQASDKPKASGQLSDKAEATVDKIEAEGGKAPEQKKDESDKQYELRLSRALQDLRNAETVTKRERAGREAAERKAAEIEKKAEQFEKMLAKGKNEEDILDFILETTGKTFEDLVNGINEKKIRPHGQKPKVDPAFQERLEKMEAENKRLAELAEKREREEAENQKRAEFEKHKSKAKTYLEDNDDEFPLIAGIGWAPAHLIQQAYRADNGDIESPARKLQKDLLEDITPMLASEKALKMLAEHAPKGAREAIAKAFKLHLAAPAAPAPEPARVPERKSAPLSRVTTETAPPPKVDKKANKRDQVRVAARIFEQSFRRQG